MKRSRFNEEQIIGMEFEVGLEMADLCRNDGTSSAATNWKAKYGRNAKQDAMVHAGLVHGLRYRSRGLLTPGATRGDEGRGIGRNGCRL